MGFLKLVLVPVLSYSEVPAQCAWRYSSMEAQCGRAREQVKTLNLFYKEVQAGNKQLSIPPYSPQI